MDLSRFFLRFAMDEAALRRAGTLLVTAILIFQATGIGYEVLSLYLFSIRPTPAAWQEQRSAAPPASPGVEAYGVVVERNLFKTTTRAAAEKGAPLVAQDVALLIDVRGTVAGEAPFGFAIVEERATRQQRLVKPGDMIAGGKVLRIKRNALDILVDGRERTIKMVEAKEAPIIPPAAAPPTATAPPSPQAPAGSVTVINRSEISEIMEDMGSMLRQALIRPYFNAGVPDGFLISNIRPDSVYRRMGIMDGDIIQEVNNRKIQSADDIMGLINLVRTAPSMTLGIKRRGNQETLNFRFQ